MHYRPLGRTGLSVSALGLGTEHLSEPQHLIPTVQRAIDAGVNYVDLAIWRPELQEAFGEALQTRRDRVFLAGHLGMGEQNGQYRKVRDAAESEQLFHAMLRRLRTDHVDVLHLSNLDEPAEYEGVVGPGGQLESARSLIRQGAARFLSLSGHNSDTLRRAVEAGFLHVLMTPIGLAWASDSRAANLWHLCASQGVGLVAMKTFNGGELFGAANPPTPAQCIHYSLTRPGLSTVLVGVKNVDELEADLACLEATDDAKDFTVAVQAFGGGRRGECTYCNHCLPCPVVIDIPAVHRLLAMSGEGQTDAVRAQYAALEARGSDCIECGLCVERCPFGVDVMANMQDAAARFER